MKKLILSASPFFFIAAVAFSQIQSSGKPYLKKYITNGVSVEIWGYNQKENLFPTERLLPTTLLSKKLLREITEMELPMANGCFIMKMAKPKR